MSETNNPSSEEGFSVTVMIETWDMSNPSYQKLMEKQRKIEEDRAAERELERKNRGVWRRIVDSIVPA